MVEALYSINNLDDVYLSCPNNPDHNFKINFFNGFMVICFYYYR